MASIFPQGHDLRVVLNYFTFLKYLILCKCPSACTHVHHVCKVPGSQKRESEVLELE